MSGSLRLLVVLAEPPLAEGGAQGRCSLARLRGLQGHGVEVVALVARQVFSLAGDPPTDLPLETVSAPPPAPGWRSRVERLRRPRGDLGRGDFAARVRELARHSDVVHLDEVDVAWCSAGIRVPALAQFNYLVRFDRSPGAPWRTEFRSWLELRLAERAAVRRHHWLAANSSTVAGELRRMAPSAEIAVAPLCLEASAYAVASLEGPPVAGLIGTAAWPPTAAAAQRLVSGVWPRLRRAVPGARLRIAGRGMLALLGAAPSPGVEVVGEVESAGEFLRGLSLLLYPLARGSGMKVKVLESIAVGLPVVTTTDGAEGIDGGDGIIVAGDDGALADRAAELLADEEARRQRGHAAREAFLSRYTPAAATAPLVDFYHRMASSR